MAALSTKEVEARGSLWIRGQAGLHSESFSKQNRKERNGKEGESAWDKVW